MSLTPAQELASLKAQRAVMAKDRDERLEAGRIADEIAEQKRLLALEEATVAAESEHGPLNRKIAIVHARRADDSIGGSIIVKRPNPQIWKRHMHTETKGAKESSDATDKLLAHCLAWPSQEEFEALMAEFPGTTPQLLAAISKLAGFRAEELAGK